MSKLYDKVIILLLAGVIICLASPARAAETADAENSCVQCHINLSSSNFVGIRSHDWVGSVHQKHGVTCDKCHGGASGTTDKAKAHSGVLGSSNPRSSVYFKNVPATCGKCHGAEFYEFKRSKHFNILKTQGRGPTCVTCHGSMVVTVLSPTNVMDVCDRCHNERMDIFPYVPQKARAVLLLLRESSALLDADSMLYKPADGSAGDEYLKAARSALHSARLDWHRFDLDNTTDHLRDVYDSLEKLSNKGRHK